MIREGLPVAPHDQGGLATAGLREQIGPVGIVHRPPARWIVGCMPEKMQDELAALAAAQGGAFTRAQAVKAGFGPAQIRTCLRRAEWTDVARGVYVTKDRLEAVHDEPCARHVLQAAGRVLTSTLGVVASHRTAALVHGLPLLGRPPVRPQLTRAPRFAGDTSAVKSLYVAGLPAAATTTKDGIPVTALARTACDVARTTSYRSGVVTADAVLRTGVHREELLAAARYCADWPCGRRAGEVARFADGRTEYVSEKGS